MERVISCINGAATVTGCQVKITYEKLYLDLQNSEELERYWADIVCKDVYGKKALKGPQSGASTDFVSPLGGQQSGEGL